MSNPAIKDQYNSNNNQLVNILERIADGLIVLDKHWHIIYINKKAGELFNLDPENLAGKDFWAVISSSTKEKFYNACIRAMDDQTQVTMEEYLPDIDKWFENIISPAPDGLTIQFKCITARKKAEEAIKESENKYRSVIDNINESLIIEDVSGRLSFANKEFSKLFGFEPEELSDLTLRDYTASESYEEVLERHHKRFNGIPVADDFIYKAKRKDGTEFWSEARITMLRQNGIITGAQTIERDITQRKLTEEKLKESVEKYRALFDQAGDAILIYSLDGTIYEFNDCVCNISGYTREEFVKLKLNDVLNGEIVINSQKLAALLAGDTVTVYRQIKRKDASLIEIEVTAKMLADGKILGLGRDITERKKAEETIKKGKELSDSIINSLPGVFYLFDKTPKMLRWNKMFESVSGYTYEELANITLMDLFHEQDRLMINSTIEETYKNGSGETEARFITKSGKIIPFFFTGVLIEYEGRPCILGTGIDISKRKEAEKALSESENRLRTILETEPECVKLVDENGGLTYMNPAGLAMLEANSLDMVKGKKYLGTINKQYRDAFIELGVNVFKDIPGKLEFEITGINGTTRWLETHAVPLKNTEGKIIYLLGVTRDITENKKAAEQVRRHNKQLRKLTAYLQNIREEERSRIGREIHDELGQYLTVLKMSVSRLHSEKKNGKAVEKDIAEILGQLENCLNITRKISHELRPAILEDLGLIDALEWHAEDFEKRTKIKTNFLTSKSELNLTADQAIGLFRIFQESLTNVARHAEAKEVAAAINMENGFVIMTIKDNGKGFDVNSVDGKISLGLLGMSERVHLMNGKYEIISASGKGTEVKVTVPV